MKLHYSKILLFVIPLIILVNTNKKPHITPHHTPIYTSRVLSEGDVQSSNYNKDTGMKSVMQQFVDRTSQRLRKYDERMKDKRQKRKEERDKNIQKIIEKDKMEKSLTEKVEKGCLRCGCALGGVAASVGLFGGLGIYGWKSAALATAKEAVKDAAMATGADKILTAGAEAGKNAVIAGMKKEFGILTLCDKTLESYFTTTDYTNVSLISRSIYTQYENSSCLPIFSQTVAGADKSICTLMGQKNLAALKVQRNAVSMNAVIKTTVETIVSDAQNAVETATEKAIEEATVTLTKQKTSEIATTCMGHQTAVIASVVALLIIALVMIIIYLVLRYRRKRKNE
ncbi:rifin PIR protein, putative [Plasmodium sp. DRC-Itaito]|nr:rifin PIR protein, putative [Plasmodium sp. DRC-Itaito]